MPLYDIKCIKCNKIEEDVFLGMSEDPQPCTQCGEDRERLCNCKSFKLVYNNKTDICSWGNEGYSSSQYYRYTDKK